MKPKKNPPQNRINDRVFFLWLFLFIAITSTWGCGEGHSPSSAQTGAIDAAIRLHASPETAHRPTAYRAAADNCGDHGIESISATVYTQNGELIATGGPWTCMAPSGVISDVPPGSGLIIVFLAKDADGNVLFRGEKDDITVYPGATANAGAVDGYSFIPAIAFPLSVVEEEIIVNIAPVAGATEYRVRAFDNETLETLALDVTTTETEIAFPAFSPNATYYWQISATDAEGNQSALSTLFPSGYSDVDHDGDRFSENLGDCDDTDPDTHIDAPERCNNADDNCNELIDENVTREVTCGLGACAGNVGIETCRFGVWSESTCDPQNGATDEVCNGIDDDCNGIADDGIPCTCEDGDTRPTSCGVGACAGNTGYETCTNGAFGEDTCDPMDGAEPNERCDGVDNDCDGTVDEDLTRITHCGTGACAENTGNEACVDGFWVGNLCDPLAGASTEICDNVDNDCDGSVDEDIRHETTCGLGACRGATGIATCLNGRLNDTCDPFQGTTPEVCNNIDDDCDGEIDNGIICTCINGRTRETTCGRGECADNTGVETCADGAYTGDTCDPLEGAADEICDGLDNDCDGEIDEGLSRTSTCGEGQCAGNTGVETCQNGIWGGNTCNPLAGASIEECDGEDNDCDGEVDEDLSHPTSCGEGACRGNTGRITCTDGRPIDTCDPYDGATDETCNSIDDDCDGVVDDGLECICVSGTTRTTSCGEGACADNTGTETCIEGLRWENNTCDPLAGASDEICDGIDNDCDGEADEDLTQPTTCGQGMCAGNTGIETCYSGEYTNDTCDPFAGSHAEDCDLLDNDCDGLVDEDLIRLATCGVGLCSDNVGTEVCINGVWGNKKCNPYDGAIAETCNGVDDDCNGIIDDLASTETTTCGVGACSGNSGQIECVDGGWFDTCDPIQGASGEVCDGIDNDCNGEVDDGIPSVQPPDGTRLSLRFDGILHIESIPTALLNAANVNIESGDDVSGTIRYMTGALERIEDTDDIYELNGTTTITFNVIHDGQTETFQANTYTVSPDNWFLGQGLINNSFDMEDSACRFTPGIINFNGRTAYMYIDPTRLSSIDMNLSHERYGEISISVDIRNACNEHIREAIAY